MCECPQAAWANIDAETTRERLFAKAKALKGFVRTKEGMVLVGTLPGTNGA